MDERTKRKAVLTFVALLVLSLPFATAWGADIFVSPTGSDLTGDGSTGNPFATIQKAIDMAVYGDKVKVSVIPATFTETIKMKSGVDVIGNGPGFTTIANPYPRTGNFTCDSCHTTGFPVGPFIDNGGVVNFTNVTNATFEGFTIASSYLPDCHHGRLVVFSS